MFCLYFIDAKQLFSKGYYITNVSPVKAARACKYFDMKLVSKDTAKWAVCFVPNRKAEFESYESNKSPVKINDFSVSRPYRSGDIVKDKGSTIDIVSDIDFKSTEFNPSSITEIMDLNEIPKDEVVTVNVKVIVITGIKKVIVLDEPCQKKPM